MKIPVLITTSKDTLNGVSIHTQFVEFENEHAADHAIQSLDIQTMVNMKPGNCGIRYQAVKLGFDGRPQS